MLAESVMVTQTLEGVSVWNKFREFSQPHTRYNEEMRERVFYCIIFDPYRVQLRDSLERRFIRRDYENKETNK